MDVSGLFDVSSCFFKTGDLRLCTKRQTMILLNKIMPAIADGILRMINGTAISCKLLFEHEKVCLNAY